MSCPVCLSPDAAVEQIKDHDVYLVKCWQCSTFRIDGLQLMYLRGPNVSFDRVIVSAMCRYHHDRGDVLFVDDPDAIVKAAPTPSTLPIALENLLVFIADHQVGFSRFVRLENMRFPVTTAASEDDFVYLKLLIQTNGYAEAPGGTVAHIATDLRLTIKGWQRVDEVRATRFDSRQAFVAMWFDDVMKNAWLNGLEPALKENGYAPMRVDAVEHNEKIDDRIIAEIRKSGLLVADFTGQRGGVYFESGFAMGLGIPVIRTCRADEIDKVHFDTRQYNHVVWSSPADLREKLSLRIQASLPRPTSISV